MISKVETNNNKLSRNFNNFLGLLLVTHLNHMETISYLLLYNKLLPLKHKRLFSHTISKGLSVVWLGDPGSGSLMAL